jgi:glutamate synthase (ferredoxin)
MTADYAITNYNKAIAKGILKLWIIGISTLHSYRAAQIFEILGLNKILLLNISIYLLGGNRFNRSRKEIKEEVSESISKLESVASLLSLEIGGIYRWKNRREAYV